MKLTELHPRWVTGDRAHAPEAVGKRAYIGLTFECPHCRTQRLGILFEPPIDDGVLWLYATWPPIEGLRWHREGETFETLTLSPSVNVGDGINIAGHWHGFIRNGEIQ